jgi:stage III sporulation protein AD
LKAASDKAMADLIKIAAVGIIAAVCVLLLKDTRSDIAFLIGLAGGILILLSVIEYFTRFFSFLDNLIAAAGLDGGIIKTLVKIVGVGYLTEFSAGIVEDSGSKSLADKISLGGKLVILVMTVPIIKALFDLITGLLN